MHRILNLELAAKKYQYCTTSKFSDLLKQRIFLFTNKTVLEYEYFLKVKFNSLTNPPLLISLLSTNIQAHCTSV